MVQTINKPQPVRKRTHKAASPTPPRASAYVTRGKGAAGPEAEVASAISLEGLIGGSPRQTLPVNANVLGMIPWMFIPRRQYQDMDLTTITPGSFSPQQLIDLLADAWPDLALALWNFQRLVVGDFTYEVRTPDNEQEDVAGKADLDRIVGNINKTWGGFRNLLGQWCMSVVLEGACAGECVPTQDITDVDDFITVQPWTIYFQRDITQKYVAFQWQPLLAAGNAFVVDPTAETPNTGALLYQNALNHGGFRMLNEVTFAYVPFDPAIDDPYGRMVFASVIQLVSFDAQILKDLRQWSHVNAFGRIDVKALSNIVLEKMPPAIRNDPKEYVKFFNGYLSNIAAGFSRINADDAFVHYDDVEVAGLNMAGGTFEIDNLIRILERRIFRALKQLPVLMGSNEGSTETHGTVQFEIYVRGIESIQRAVAALVERLLNVALRIRGRNSMVHFAFNPIRVTDRIKDAAAEGTEIKNAASMRDQGWITQDEASIKITGSAAVAPGPNPDPMAAPDEPDAAGDQTKAKAKAPAPVPADVSDGKAAKGAVAAPANDEDEGAIEDAQDKADAQSRGELAAGRAQPTAVRDLLAPTLLAQPGNAHVKSLAAQGDPAPRQAPAPLTVRASAPDQDPTGNTGVMAAFMLHPDAASQLAMPGGLPASDLHCTLAFLGDSTQLDDATIAGLHSVVAAYASNPDHQPLTGQVAGMGRFTSVPKGSPHPVYAAVDMPGLAELRHGLVRAIDETFGLVAKDHGFTPHITLAYLDPDQPSPTDPLPAVDLHFDQLCLAVGDQRTYYPLGATVPPPDQGADKKRDTPLVVADQNARSHQGARAAKTTDKKPDKVAQHSPARVAHTAKMQMAVRKHLAGTSVSRDLVQHIISTHAPKRRKRPDGGVRALTGSERDQLRKNIGVALQNEIPDYDDDFTDLITGYNTDAYNLAGQEAVDTVGLTGTFDLTNATLIAALGARALQSVGYMQGTTRDQLTTVIVDGIGSGDDVAAIDASLQDRIAAMADTRSEDIAQTETGHYWTTASLKVWLNNDVPYKTWRTGDNPDPNAGATGATPCRDNAYASPIAMADSFPDGSDGPPAHDRCGCDLEPEGNPSDAAQANPWLGD